MGDDNAYWINLLNVFLHDPPDKALDIPNHVGRGERYVKSAVGSKVDVIKNPDWDSSSIERLPLPKERIIVGLENGSLSIRHPLSGQKVDLPDLSLNESFVSKTIERIVEKESDERKLFFLIWRLLPGMLAEQPANFHYLHLPAETRAPDHTIWHHCDTAAALYPTYLDLNKNGAALLSFQLGPVQEFISTARTLRDLWTGSMILSWLTFQAIVPVVETYGPTALIYPALRGLPFMDSWMLDKLDIGKKKEYLEKEFDRMRLSPCLPNKFMAVVPWGEDGKSAKDIAHMCENAVRGKWEELTEAVREELAGSLSSIDENWDNRWDDQVGNFFDIKTSLLPLKDSAEATISKAFAKNSFEEMYSNVKNVNKLFEKAGGAAFKAKAGAWQAQVELSARLMEAKRAVRNVPPDTKDDAMLPPKCSMMGSYEQMGPAGLDDSKKFWEAASKITIDGVRLRSSERLCSVALVKRFAEPAYLREELGLAKWRFEDTATVAAAKWLKEEPKLDPKKHGSWSGQWLHWPKKDYKEDEEPNIPDDVWKLLTEKKKEEKSGKPPAYYAILMMDADNMGKWLRGDKAPAIGDIYHEKIISYLKKQVPDVEKHLQAKRPLGPSAHMAMSEALTNFAVHVVPNVIEDHDGTLIYAGGDDVLAFLPVESAVQCANSLYRAFQGKPDFNGGAKNKGFYRIENRDMLMMGHTATLSAGIAIAHYKEDLRFALDKARSAEKMAKSAGRDRLALSVMRRSGEHATAVMNWDFTDNFSCWVNAFKNGASDRWVYHLRQELPTLEGKGLPVDLMKSEIKRQLNRAEKETRVKFGEDERGDEKISAGSKMQGLFDKYCASLMKQDVDRRDCNDKANLSDAALLKDFITLLQSASFFTRGRD
ncbi:MAG: type III-B CRISPR-associated protein Cas10/Cmr2 [Nitrospinae bacterium]|nr:type III-B CRISPR-associated protein Cas10/Cmr2 [Nitrospinota bacterium]MBF0633508.1 type III-B CRISPR-associated protein Cas10/Cmr2 [Nitrospinota bacterium]